jgi:hypothetical protein
VHASDTALRERLALRLEELRHELAKGQQALAEVQVHQDALRQSVLRISGAVQVLEEELARTPLAVAVEPQREVA